MIINDDDKKMIFPESLSEKPVDEAPAYVYKKDTEKKLPGWLILFMISSGLGMLITFFSYTTTFNIADYDLESSSFLPYVGATLDTFFILGLVSFGIYMIYSFIGRNPNAPVYGIIYCCLLLFSNLLQILGAVMGGGFDESTYMGGAKQVIRGLVWCLVWISYLVTSTKIKEVYPKGERKISDKMIGLVAAIVFCPVLWLLIAVFVGISAEM